MSAQAWIEALQKTSKDPSRRMRASNYWPPSGMDDEIVVFKNKDMTQYYTLDPTRRLLEHADQGGPGSRLFNIIWDPQSSPEKTEFCEVIESDDTAYGQFDARIPPADTQPYEVFSLQLFGPQIPCVCVALGRLVENEMVDGKIEQRTTNRVLILNLSTEPTSVWHIFDYHMVDYDHYNFYRWRWTNRLGQYHDVDKSKNLQPGDFEPRVQDSSALCNGNISHQHYSSIAQHTNLRDTRQPLPGCMTQSGDKPSMNDSSRAFFSRFRNHDIGLLASDLDTWSAEGFDYGEVDYCLKNSQFRLGSSLRVRHATDGEESDVEQTRIKFKRYMESCLDVGCVRN
ncbi:MAG: hypothetical protein LQ338_006879 [Usnochroma carphineum]|nr:MAG: hypothetical protein LQ338_006879 [Usnochroma carphineum]